MWKPATMRTSSWAREWLIGHGQDKRALLRML